MSHRIRTRQRTGSTPGSRQARYGIRRQACLLLAAGLLWGCAEGGGGGSAGGGDVAGDGAGGGPGPVVAEESATVGPEGGTVALDGAALTVPPGALAAPTEITVSRRDGSPEGVEALSPLFEFAPAGLRFALPAELRLDYEGDEAEATVLRAEALGEPFAPVPGAALAEGEALAAIDGFSIFLVGRRPHPAGGEFEVDGIRYSAAPVSLGEIEGFGFSYETGAGVDDGAGEPGRVWYDGAACFTFRQDGTGMKDTMGGQSANTGMFPRAPLSSAPGAASGGWAPHRDSSVNSPFAAGFERDSAMWDFQWGVRLEEDGSVYLDFAGRYEFYIRFTAEDGPWSDTVSWEPGAGPQSALLVLDQPTEDPPADQHFCFFRVRREGEGGEARICRERTGGFPAATEHACYDRGMLDGPYRVTTAEGIEIEAGEFALGRPVGAWTFAGPTGLPRASGSYDEAGVRFGAWAFYDDLGHPQETWSFKGILTTDAFGTHEWVDGPYTRYRAPSEGIPSGHVQEEGTYTRGKKDAWWTEYDDRDRLITATQYDVERQLPTGSQSCVSVEGEQVCEDVTRSAILQVIHYDWGICNPGENYMSVLGFERAGPETCFEVEGDPHEPVQGAPTECPGACQM